MATQLLRENRIERRVELGTERECRRVFSRRRREAGRAILVAEESLGMPRARIDGTLLAFAPAIVRRIGPWQIEVRVIAIVADLVVHLAVTREHAREPLETMTCLVQYVGDAIASGHAPRV